MKEFRIHMTRNEMEKLYSSLGNIRNDNSHQNNVQSIQKILSDAYNDDYQQNEFMFICNRSEVMTLRKAVDINSELSITIK